MEHDVGGEATPLIAVDLVLQAFGDAVCRWLAPVSGDGVPQHRGHAQLSRNAQHIGAAATEGRAKVAHRLPGNLLERVAGSNHLFANTSGTGERKVGVAPTVVADKVAGLSNTPHQHGLGLGITAHHEKCRPHITACQGVKQPRSTRRVGTVVKGQGQFSGVRRSDECAPKDSRCGPHGRVSVAARRQSKNGKGAQPCVNFCGHARIHPF